MLVNTGIQCSWCWILKCLLFFFSWFQWNVRAPRFFHSLLLLCINCDNICLNVVICYSTNDFFFNDMKNNRFYQMMLYLLFAHINFLHCPFNREGRVHQLIFFTECFTLKCAFISLEHGMLLQFLRFLFFFFLFCSLAKTPFHSQLI